MRRWFAFAFLALVAIGWLASGSEDTAPALSPTTPTPQQPVAAKSTEAPAVPNALDTAQTLKTYLDENFSETTWHRHITGVKVFLSAAWIETDLYPDADAAEPASRICSGVSSYVFTNIDTLGLGAVTVRAVDGQRLVMRQSVGDPC